MAPLAGEREATREQIGDKARMKFHAEAEFDRDSVLDMVAIAEAHRSHYRVAQNSAFTPHLW